MDKHEQHYISSRARHYREHDPTFAAWAAGYGVISHLDETQVRIFDFATELEQRGIVPSRKAVFDTLAAADRLASMAMWLVVHMSYAKRVRLDGLELTAADFKTDPQGHVGGSLNMVPAYCGYLACNALTGLTRSWLMGQGHCVAAIDACNVLVGNVTPEHAARYGVDERGLTRLVQDFYSYAITADGHPASALGSHVNAHTAGGISEGGYLGFAELQYVHMPLPGERLVAFLSDGAFEEQRGSDWAPRWWRSEDSGMVVPIMIANGRRIEQRSTMAQQGGTHWFARHLKLNGFDPVIIDGTDPAAFVWAIWEMEERLTACADALRAGHGHYPVPLHYAIAEAPKGFGFPGAGSNRAHNLPLAGSPYRDAEARAEFNAGAAALYVPVTDWPEILSRFDNHVAQRRPLERDHALVRQHVAPLQAVTPAWRERDAVDSAMAALDGLFCELVKANPTHRVRVGNPDELASNRMTNTLWQCRHRVYSPEPGLPEAVDGQIITALNEEAVACAALANKGGVNLVVSYEAFAVKMLGAMRQELLFARHQKQVGRTPAWLGIPFLLTSHTWENGKNEQSHQDPTLCEALLGEMSDTAIVRFPADANTAMACLNDCYQRRAELHALIVSKSELPVVFTAEQAKQLVDEGALLVKGPSQARIQLIAVGALQLQECLKAWCRLEAAGVAAAVIYLLEPGRFRAGRDAHEAAYQSASLGPLFSVPVSARIIVSHTRPEPLLGVLRPLDTGTSTRCLGYLNQGGTLNSAGLLYANHSTWLHVLMTVASCLSRETSEWLRPDELAVLNGDGDILSLVVAGPRS
ncbi:MAG: xylulose 5-phosphate 3-epimerase [Pseudomonadota bacterium]